MATEKVTYELTLRDMMSKGLEDINKKLAAVEGKLGSVQKTATNTGSSMSNSLKAGFASIAALGIGAIATDIVKTASSLEGMRNAIVFASGSTEEGAKNLQFLSDVTKKLPIDLEAAHEGFKTLMGATMGTSLAGQGTRDIFEKVGTAAAVMGLSADSQKGVFLALGQMISKGTVQAEELRGQLGERLPGAFIQFAKSQGMSVAELGEQMKAGNILAEKSLKKFADFLQKSYAGGLDKANDSIQANLTRLNNLKTELIIGLIPAISQAAKGMANFGVSLYSNIEPLKEMLGFVYDIGKNLLVSMSAPFMEIFSMFGGLTDSINWMSVALKTLATTTMIALLPLRILLNTVTLIYDTFTLLIQSAKNAANAISGVFSRDWNKVNEAWENQKESMSNFGTKQMDKFVKPFQEIKDIWTDSKGTLGTTSTATGSNNALSSAMGLGGGTDTNLKSELDSIKGKAPSNTYINIEALIKGDINNMISSVQNAEKDMNMMLEKLEAALLTVVSDVNKIQN